MYSLGAILYELLTGRQPFRGATVYATLHQVKTAEPVPPSRLVPGLPRDIETIAIKCLRKDPGKRYESALALAEDLARFQAGETDPGPAGERARARLAVVPAQPGARLRRSARWRRHSWPWRAFRSSTPTSKSISREKQDEARKEADLQLAISDFERGEALCEKGEVGPGLLRLIASWQAAREAEDPRLAKRWPAPASRPGSASTRGPGRSSLIKAASHLSPSARTARRSLPAAAITRPGSGTRPPAGRAGPPLEHKGPGHRGGVQPRRQDRLDRQLRCDGPVLGRAHRTTHRLAAQTSEHGLFRRLQPRRQDRVDRKLGPDGPALGRVDRQAHRPSAETSRMGLGRGLQPGRQDGDHRKLGRHRPALERGDRPAHRRTAASTSSLVSAVAFCPDGKTVATASFDSDRPDLGRRHRQTRRHAPSASTRGPHPGFQPGRQDDLDRRHRQPGTPVEHGHVSGDRPALAARRPGRPRWPTVRDGKTIATGSNDATGRLWDAATGTLDRPAAAASGTGLERRVQPRRQDRRHRQQRRDGPALGRRRRPAHGPAAHERRGGLRRGIQPRRQDGLDRLRRQCRAAVGGDHRPADRPTHDSSRRRACRGVQPRRQVDLDWLRRLAGPALGHGHRQAPATPHSSIPGPSTRSRFAPTARRS